LYWWQHCYYADTDDFPSIGQLSNAVVGVMANLYTNQVNRRGHRIYAVGSGALLRDNYFGAGNPCLRPARSDTNILMAARWRLRGEDGSYSYHLHRRLIGSEDQRDGVWTDAGYTQQVTSASTFVIAGFFRTKTGSLIDSFTVAGQPSMWQLRHGTKRRNNRFWAP